MLEFRDILPHVSALAGETSRRAAARDAQLTVALRQMIMPPDERVRQAGRIEDDKQRWLKARPLDPTAAWNGAIEPSGTPAQYTAIACDGSQIPLDRHEIAPCYLLNVGRVAIHYGTGERPTLNSTANLFYREEDLLMEASDADGGESATVYLNDKELATRRFLAEMDALAELVEACAGRPDAVAFVDGTLILWAQEAETSRRRNEVLGQFLGVMEKAKAAGVPMIGYLSRPASREVIGALRITLCPDKCLAFKNCQCPEPQPQPCEGIALLTDADLFGRILSTGRRSALFLSDSRVLDSYKPDDQKIAFFYLHTGSEVARVELPLWVAKDAALLDRCHAVALDQARKGSGYPVCLSEAHEQAIVRGPEREAFFQLVERAFVKSGIPAMRTAKAVAKRRRPV